MKGTLIFNLPAEQEDFEMAQKGWKYKAVLDEIWHNVWRPRHKHGYSEYRINELLEDPKCQELVDILEKLYQDTISERLND